MDDGEQGQKCSTLAVLTRVNAVVSRWRRSQGEGAVFVIHDNMIVF